MGSTGPKFFRCDFDNGNVQGDDDEPAVQGQATPQATQRASHAGGGEPRRAACTGHGCKSQGQQHGDSEAAAGAARHNFWG